MMKWRAFALCVALAGIPALACEGVDPRDPGVLNRDGGLGGSAPGGSGGADASGASGGGGGASGAASGGTGGDGGGTGGDGGGTGGGGGSVGTCASGTKSCGGDVCIPDGDCCETCGPFEQCGSDGSCSCIDGAFGTGCTGRFLELSPVGVSDEDSEATAVSGNGRVVVGWSGALGVSPPTQRAASWEWEAGLSADLGTLTVDQPESPSSVATAVNENGAIVVGVSSLVANVTGEVPVRWVNGSLQRLELGEFNIFGRAEAVSGDGATAAGWISSDGGAFVGAVWSATALDGSSPYTSSPDSVRFFALSGSDSFGERASSPVDAFAGTLRTIPSGGLSGFVSAASSAGQFLAGTLDGDQPARWVGTGANDPELLPGPGQAEDVSTDGTVVGTSGGAAVLWTTSGQRRAVLDVLVEANATGISGWTFSSAKGISDDGRVIVGAGTFGGRSRGWVARLPIAP